ncbi:MAG TPA: pentapeptide repeat-containing protein [Gemmata sp.]
MPAAEPSFPCAAVAGKSFVLATTSRDRSAVEEVTQFITSLGGRVVEAVMPRLDYVVVLDRHPDRPTPEERQAETHSVQVLGRADFYRLISPTRDESLALLRGGEPGLAQWRLRHNDMHWSPIDLSEANLRGATLTNIVLYGVKLDGADLSDADLSGSSLGDFVRVTLDRANLSNAHVYHLTDCSARGADLSSTHLSQTVIVRTDLTGARLTRATGYSVRSEGSVFRDADLTGAKLGESTFVRGTFDGADLSRAYLDQSDFSGSTFRGAVLAGAGLMRANLTRADLTGSDLSRSNLAGADLTGAAVEGANLTDANLYAAKLDALGPGQPLGLVAPPPVAVDRIGPGMRALEERWRQAGSIEVSLHIDPDERGAETVHLLIRDGRRGYVRGYSSVPDQPEAGSCQADTLCEAMLELAQRWPGAELYLETLHVRSGSSKQSQRGLHEQAMAAWHEAFGRPTPTAAERKATQAAHRQRFLDWLRGGPEGIEHWNALSSEALARAGHFRRSDLRDADLRGADLSPHRGVALGGLDFTLANFDRANLTKSNLRGCVLVEVSLRSASLDGASCPGADLRRADLSGASLRGSSLRTAKCSGTDFRGADLTKADLDGADLRGANLGSANLERVRLKDAVYDETTVFPAGFTFPVKPAEPPVGLEVGCRVRVVGGTFAGHEVEVQAVDEPASRLTAIVTFWGRPLQLDLEFDDIELA